jgi:hypothetical protein
MKNDDMSQAIVFENEPINALQGEGFFVSVDQMAISIIVCTAIVLIGFLVLAQLAASSFLSRLVLYSRHHLYDLSSDQSFPSIFTLRNL